jgi:hypothetical protein
MKTRTLNKLIDDAIRAELTVLRVQTSEGPEWLIFNPLTEVGVKVWPNGDATRTDVPPELVIKIRTVTAVRHLLSLP